MNGHNTFVATTLPTEIYDEIAEIKFVDCLTRASVLRKLIIIGLESYRKQQNQFDDGFGN